jgi:hypothetical protein
MEGVPARARRLFDSLDLTITYDHRRRVGA